MLQVDVDEAVIRRVVEGLPFGQLPGGHAFIVVGYDLVDDGVGDIPGLEDDQSLRVASSGTSGYLRHQLEGTFVGTEIGVIQQGVCIEDAHHADPLEVQAFGHHLRADEDVRPTFGKVIDDAFVSRAGTGGVQIHSGYPCLREQGFDFIFYLLCAEAAGTQVSAVACRASAGQGFGVAAIVARQHVQPFMVGQADVAVLAFGHPATRVAFNHGGKAAPVLEEDDLLFALQCLADVLQQQGRERTGHALLASEFADIHRDDLRQAHRLVAFAQGDEGVFLRLGIVPTLQAWGGGAQQSFGSAERGEDDGGIAGMVAWSGVLLLVGGFMLFVHNNQLQPLEGQEYGGTYPQDDIVGMVGQLALPDFHPFGIREFGVVDAQAGAEYASQASGDLGSERYLGKQIQYLSAALQHFLNQMDINLCLSAGRDSVEQAYILFTQGGDDFIVGTLLGRGQLAGRLHLGGEQVGVQTADFCLVGFKDTTSHQAIEYGRSGTSPLQQIAFGHGAFTASQGP